MQSILDRLTSKELGLLFPITLSEPDPHWPKIFEAEKKLVADTLGENTYLRIEHIGSTAVPS